MDDNDGYDTDVVYGTYSTLVTYTKKLVEMCCGVTVCSSTMNTCPIPAKIKLFNAAVIVLVHPSAITDEERSASCPSIPHNRTCLSSLSYSIIRNEICL